MGPLLEWGIAFVTTFADDILRATAHYQERLAQEGLSFLVGSESSLRALGVAPSALFRNENQWLPDFTVDDFRKSRPQEHLPLMLRLLHTACLIVAAYLTGARGDEIHQWRFGCAPAPHLTPEGALLHRIHGTTKKGREQADLATWATVPEATQAIHIAEQVQRAVGHTDGLVFGATPNRRLNAGTVRNRLQEFVDVVNSRLVPHTTHPKAFAIPSDPHGPLGLRRFRRTLAWFIRNQPGGHVTLALQYQHLSSRMGSGYAGTQEAGFNDLLLEEDWEHRRRTLDRLASILAEGAGIGGPAAARAIEAAARLPRPLTSGDERRLRKDQTLMIYDNPAAVALCVYRAHNALCEKTRFANSDAAPDLVGCVDGCPNCARTDDHIGDLRIKANRLRAHAETQPIPIARSLITQAERCERLAEQSQDTRLVANLNLSDQSSSPEIRSHDAPANPQGMPKLVLDAVLTDSSSAELPQTSRSPRRNSQSGAKPNLRSHSE